MERPLRWSCDPIAAIAGWTSVGDLRFEGSRLEVFVRDLGEPDRRVQASVAGGVAVGWSADGRDLYYCTDGALWAAPVSVGPKMAIGRPVRLFEIAGELGNGSFDVRVRVMPDGQSFLALEGPASSGAHIRVMRHGLQRLLDQAR